MSNPLAVVPTPKEPTEPIDIVRDYYDTLTNKDKKRFCVLLGHTQTYVVDQLLSNNPNQMRLMDHRVDDLYRACRKKISRQRIRDWNAARRLHLHRDPVQLEMDFGE
jgi:hypothetical protein